MKRASLAGCAVLVACGGAAAARPVCPGVSANATGGTSSEAASTSGVPAVNAGPDTDLVLLLRPVVVPSPAVHVEITLTHADAATGAWHLARGAATRVSKASAHDDGGDIGVAVAPAAAGGGVDLTLARAPHGAQVTVAYDVAAGDDAPDDPLGLYVVDDRFRVAGEKLVALPASAETGRGSALVRIEGDALRASAAASSFGVGNARKTTVPFRALRYANYVAGSLGVQVIDDPAAGHDEGAWLGYTSFDPRPTVAELAQVRTSLAEMFKTQPDSTPWTYLFVSQTRPIGSFTTTPRWTSALLQVGPAEPWGASLRLSTAQQLARQWVGGILRIASEPGHEGESAWFSEGVSRYAATALLARLGLLSPNDVRDAVSGELSVVATSPDATMPGAQLGALVAKDDVARATAMARGALYAIAESAAIRAHTKGERGLVDALAKLVREVQDGKRSTLSAAAWVDAVGSDDPDAAHTFDALVVRGERPQLPRAALGPCFRPGTGEYVAFDPGFDLSATRASADGHAVGVRAGGPAAKAGLQEGDVVESMQAREGDGTVPVKLTVMRAGSKVTLTYVPAGARGRGQTWTRVPGLPDDRCAAPL